MLMVGFPGEMADEAMDTLSASIRNYSDVFWENFYGQWLTQH